MVIILTDEIWLFREKKYIIACKEPDIDVEFNVKSILDIDKAITENAICEKNFGHKIRYNSA